MALPCFCCARQERIHASHARGHAHRTRVTIENGRIGEYRRSGSVRAKTEWLSDSIAANGLDSQFSAEYASGFDEERGSVPARY